MRKALIATLLLLVAAPAHADEQVSRVARQVETRLDTRVGVAAHDVASGTWWLHNADQRFPMASTFKVLACGALLASDVEDKPTSLIADLQDYSPVTKDLVGQTVSPYRLCDAAMRTSDNTAANLVLQAIGGPQALTLFLRQLGDHTMRLDRWEPELNAGVPGDERDTTTPRAVVPTLEHLVLGDALPRSRRTVLTHWMQSNEVADRLLRAVVPPDWAIGDRSGAGGHGTRGIVAVMWPAPSRPVVAAIYITETTASMKQRDAAIAEIGRALVEAIND